MNANEARKQSDKNALLKEGENLLRNEVENLAAQVAENEKHRRWYNDAKQSIEEDIKYAVEAGQKRASYILHSHSEQGPYSNPMYGKGFLKLSEFAPELKRVMKEFEKRGYTVSIEEEDRCIDSSIAYMNSGGECGSMDKYWVYQTVLVVKW